MPDMKRAILGGLGLSVAVLSFAAPVPAGAGDQVELKPNLRPLKPVDIRVDEVGGVKSIEFSTNVLNRGTGPLELRPVAENCDEDADPTGDDDRAAYQRIYHSEDGVFNPGLRETDPPSYTETEVGCFNFHPAHDHWHYDDFGLYELFKIRSNGSLALKRSSNKVSFCMVDTRRDPNLGLPGTPSVGYYKPHPTPGGEPEPQPCGQDNITGISIGWVDSYPSYLPGQSLPIEGLLDGAYCLRITTDTSARLLETNNFDNRRQVRFRLDGDTAVVKANKPCTRVAN